MDFYYKKINKIRKSLFKITDNDLLNIPFNIETKNIVLAKTDLAKQRLIRIVSYIKDEKYNRIATKPLSNLKKHNLFSNIFSKLFNF